MNAILKCVRTILFVPQPAVTAERAIEIAIAEMTKGQPEGTPRMRMPVAREGIWNWTVDFAPMCRPMNVMIIDNQTGRVRRHIWLPR